MIFNTMLCIVCTIPRSYISLCIIIHVTCALSCLHRLINTKISTDQNKDAIFVVAISKTPYRKGLTRIWQSPINQTILKGEKQS